MLAVVAPEIDRNTTSSAAGTDASPPVRAKLVVVVPGDVIGSVPFWRPTN